MTTVLEIRTALGPARWHVDSPAGDSSVVLALGHGAGGGVDAPDLMLLARHLPRAGVSVARFEQPWRVAGRRVAGSPRQLDLAWVEGLAALGPFGVPLVLGGRSAGARVACRTAEQSGASGVLTLAFPLHPPGRPQVSRAEELPSLPILAVQGGRDAFGGAAELAAVLDRRLHTQVTVPGADHALRVRRSGPVTQREADELLLLAARRWLCDLALGNADGATGR